MIPILLTTTLFIANSPSLQNRKYNSESRTANRAENGLTNQVRRGIEKKKKRKYELSKRERDERYANSTEGTPPDSATDA